MDLDTTVAQWSALVGFFLPFLMALILQSQWSAALKSFLAFGVALAAAVPTAYLSGDISGKDWFTSAVVILSVALATYQGFWKPTGIAPTVERTTNVTTPG